MKKIYVPIKYLPKSLSKKDKNEQANMLIKSRKMYKSNKYYTRKKVKSYKSKTSKHILDAKRIYNIDKISASSKELSNLSGCSVYAMNKIVKKGEGAYYSSGSRPNQTAQSWGIARLASSITGGKSAAVDFSIIKKGCDHSKKAYTLAMHSRRINKSGKRKVPKISYKS
jgi:hypothetical protein